MLALAVFLVPITDDIIDLRFPRTTG